MKALLIVLLMSYALISCAESPDRENSKLNISVKTFDGKSTSWLRFYGHDGADVIPVTLDFDFDNVQALIVTDEHAAKKRCGQDYASNKAKNILYLSFDPVKNLHQIKTRIGLPCLYQRTAILNLQVITQKGSEYSRLKTFTIDPRSSAQQIIDSKMNQ
jgi:sporulation protein YlmC with PRC-barrel domain